MKNCLFLLLLMVAVADAQTASRKLHFKATLVDTHNDILTTCIDNGYAFDSDLRGKTHSDLNRLMEGGVDVQFFSVWCDGQKPNPYAWANREIDTLIAVAKRNPDKMLLAKDAEDIAKAIKNHQLAVMFGVEGGHMIENDLDKLDSLYQKGVRYMTLTWNNSTSWATSAMDESKDTTNALHKGLNEFGKQVIQRMNRLGMMVDLSHVGEQTFFDALAITKKPVVVSHSCVHSICPVFRNLKDDQLKALAQNGGVMQINFFSGFLDSNFQKNNKVFGLKHKAERDSLLKINPEPHFADTYLFAKYPDEVENMRAPFELLMQHIDYVVQLIGIDHVGLGSDFDGINSTPKLLNDVTTYPLITDALLAKGYTPDEVRKILGENLLRVLRANEL